MASSRDRGKSAYEKRQKRRVIRQLHDAISRNNIEDVQSIITPDVDVNFEYGGQSALQIAVLKGHYDLCEILISHGANVDKMDAEEKSLLNMAAWRGFYKITKLLIDHSAELDVTNNHGSTALNSAAYRGHEDIVQLLVEAGSDVDRSNSHGQTPLITAAREGFAGVAKILIEGQCDLNWKDHERASALTSAAARGHADMVQLLVSKGADLNIAEHYGYTALYLAAKNGHTEVVHHLIQANANLNQASTKQVTPFLEAVRGQHLDIVALLLDAKCDCNIAERSTKQTPLHAAVRQACQYFGSSQKDVTMVKMLIEAGCDLNAADQYGWTALYQSAFGGETDITRLLLDNKVRLDLATDNGDLPLHGAVFGNKPEIVEMLIKAGCSVNSVNKKNQLPLYTAVDLRAKIEIIKLLLDSGSKVDVCESDHQRSPLFAAIQHDFVEAVQLLIKAGCGVDLPDKDGDTALWMACDKGNEQIVKALLDEESCDINAGVTHIPIHAAAVHGYLSIAEMLVDRGCDVNKMTDICTTALQLACDMNHMPIIKLLVKWGCDPTVSYHVKLPQKCCAVYGDPHPHMEQEPLYHAIKNDSLLMVKIILCATPKMPYKVLMSLRDILFRTDYAARAGLSRRMVIQYAEFFSQVLRRPRKLQEECRGTIRQALGQQLARKIEHVTLPSKLKNYVLLLDVM